MGEVISVELQLCGSRGAAPPAGLSEHFASARGHLRRRNDAQGDVGVAKRAFRERVFMPHLFQERASNPNPGGSDQGVKSIWANLQYNFFGVISKRPVRLRGSEWCGLGTDGIRAQCSYFCGLRLNRRSNLFEP
jgi:hypothetical protein